MSIQPLKSLCGQKIAAVTFDGPQIHFPLQTIPNELAFFVIDQIRHQHGINTIHVMGIRGDEFQKFKIEVPCEKKVYQIREFIRKEIGRDRIWSVSLQFEEQWLKDVKTLLDYNILPGTTHSILVGLYAQDSDLSDLHGILTEGMTDGIVKV
jgi:hypothetical protein